jgi:hypothetical protein
MECEATYLTHSIITRGLRIQSVRERWEHPCHPITGRHRPVFLIKFALLGVLLLPFDFSADDVMREKSHHHITVLVESSNYSPHFLPTLML